jgi:hypothetical protein
MTRDPKIIPLNKELYASVYHQESSHEASLVDGTRPPPGNPTTYHILDRVLRASPMFDLDRFFFDSSVSSLLRVCFKPILQVREIINSFVIFRPPLGVECILQYAKQKTMTIEC